MTCPSCNSTAIRVIYLGAPMNFCTDADCATLWGVWSWLPVLFPITPEGGWVFFAYEGGYLPALWRWLRGGES